MDEITIKKVDPLDPDILEEWVSALGDQALCVDCCRGRHSEWSWQVYVGVMEFVRSEPLESELVNAITVALCVVPGARDACREGRENWAVAGNPTGPDLVRAAAEVAERFAPRTRELLDAIERGEGPELDDKPWWDS